MARKTELKSRSISF